MILNFKKIDKNIDTIIPKYTDIGNSGLDICASLSDDVEILPNEIKLIGTNLCAEVPIGFEIQVRPRSGLALKHGITVLNTPGTIDSNYRGEIGIILYNVKNEPYKVKNGDRIAQLVVSRVEHPLISLKDELSETNRNEKGFGSSGV